jgi:hypothetical protein
MEHEVKAIEGFIDFLHEEFNEELHKPYVDWALAKQDFRTFIAGYLLKFKQKEGLI